MKLIDTSGWIEFFRRNGDPVVKSRIAEWMRMGACAYTCPIRFELLVGAKPNEIKNVLTGLELSTRVKLLPGDWDRAGFLGSRLRSAGITIPTTDLLVGIVAERKKWPLLARDAHFKQLVDTVLPDLILV